MITVNDFCEIVKVFYSLHGNRRCADPKVADGWNVFPKPQAFGRTRREHFLNKEEGN